MVHCHIVVSVILNIVIYYCLVLLMGIDDWKIWFSLISIYCLVHSSLARVLNKII